MRIGKGMRLVALPALAEAKVLPYEAMRLQGMRKAAPPRRIGLHKSHMDRLLDLTHFSPKPGRGGL
jgi:antitoxin HicB